MRLLVSEYICSGAWVDDGDSSLVTEGRAMLLAVLRDAARVPGLEVATIWGARRERFPVQGVPYQLAHSPEEEIELLAELAAWSDATLLIAPEFDGILTHRALLVEGVGGRLCGPSPLAITACTDKLDLASHLQAAGVSTIPTYELHLEQAQPSDVLYPCVIKPRDGAGSQATFLVQSAAEFTRLCPTWRKLSLLGQAIWQPYLPGRAVSVAVLITPEQYRYEALPPCEQILAADGSFTYLGGVIPARDVDIAALQQAAISACRVVPGLRGYVGVDLIIPEDVAGAPVVVEINPRITTSYLGYSQMCEQNLIAHWLQASDDPAALTWKSGTWAYFPDGTVNRV